MMENECPSCHYKGPNCPNMDANGVHKVCPICTMPLHPTEGCLKHAKRGYVPTMIPTVIPFQYIEEKDSLEYPLDAPTDEALKDNKDKTKKRRFRK